MATKTAAKKTTTTRAAAKKVPAKKAVLKKRAVKRSALDLKPIKAKVGKTELYDMLAEHSELTRKQVRTLFEHLSELAKASMMPKGIGVFQVPGVVTLKTRKVPARKVEAIKKGTMVRNPRTGQETPHAGRKAYVKPATVKVRAVPMANMKRAALGTE
jgi:hypothetical protein